MQTIELHDKVTNAYRTLEKLDLLLNDLRFQFLEPVSVLYGSGKDLSLRMTLEVESDRAILRAELADSVLSEAMRLLDDLTGEIERELLQNGGHHAKLKGQACNARE